MLDIKLIRTQPERVVELLGRRGEDISLTSILALDAENRSLTLRVQELRSQRNQLAKQVGTARVKGTDSSELEQRGAEIANELEALEPKLSELEASLHEELSRLPNLPAERAPAGGKENNQVVRVWGEKPALPEKFLDHVTLSKNLGLVDHERGVKLGGSGFWLYTGDGAALEWSLIDFFCREHRRDGYTFFLPPHLLTRENGYAAGQFPKFEEDVFHIAKDESSRDRFLVPTAETAILNVYRDEILLKEQLPIKCFAYTPCYRRERGASRTEERGTVRGHQFNKVEMFQFVTPEQAEEALQELVRRAEQLLEKLELHYRTSLLAAGDTSAAMSLTYDIEVWIPSMQTYKEVSSVSWACDFQSRRANLRYRDGKQTRFLHTLNGSGLATSRVFPALLEQHQLPDGSVWLPDCLSGWVGKKTLTPKA